MKHSRSTQEQIARDIPEQEAGQETADVFVPPFCKWKAKFGGLEVPHSRLGGRTPLDIAALPSKGLSTSRTLLLNAIKSGTNHALEGVRPPAIGTIRAVLNRHGLRKKPQQTKTLAV